MIGSTQDVSEYYDRNTKRFLTSGHGAQQHAIRRAVWGPRADRRSDAIQFVNSLVLRELQAVNARRVVDLGCGVGGSMLYLSESHDALYLGATISEVQVAIGSQLINNRKAAPSVGSTGANSRDTTNDDAGAMRIHLADFCRGEFWKRVGEQIDLAYAIESLIHVESVNALFGYLGAAVRRGGCLIICDDTLAAARRPGAGNLRARRWLREFRSGWHAPGLRRAGQQDASARAAGFYLVERRDLTPYLELDRPRDIVTRAAMSLFRWLPPAWAWYANLLGGNALQLCLKHGVVRYLYSVYEKR